MGLVNLVNNVPQNTCDLWSVESRNMDQRVKCKENRPDPGPGIINGGWCLWSNGILGEDVYIPAAGTYGVVVRAYGEPLGGIWPLMALSVDGVAGEPVTVGSGVYIDYSFQVALAPGVHSHSLHPKGPGIDSEK